VFASFGEMKTKKLKGSFLGSALEFRVLSEPAQLSELLKVGAELQFRFFKFQGWTFLSHEIFLDGLRLVTALEFVDEDSHRAQVDLDRAVECTYSKWKKDLCVGPFKSEFQKEILLGLLVGTQRPLRMIDYSELANRAGRQLAVRAAASVMSSNPWPVIFPCHRVLPKSSLLRLRGRVSLNHNPSKIDVGKYGGTKYSKGASIKKLILEIEGLI